MHFDRLDEIYVMEKSNSQFDKVVLSSLNSLYDRSDRFAQIASKSCLVPILSANICPPVSW
jgi:hypothetical protein